MGVASQTESWRRCALCHRPNLAGVPLNRRYCRACLSLTRHERTKRLRLEPGTTKNRDGRQFLYAEVDEVRAAMDGLWVRHEALERRGILTPLVFCRRQGQGIRTF